ncbi:MAG TPA: PD-(D/E)XK nuclease family protein [Candidatus Limnocylindrales bacterium]
MLEERFAELAREWHASVPVPAAPDEDTFRTLRAEAAAIRAVGNWVSGPGDLPSILGRQRDEMFHSRLIGWLLNPSGRHGLGDRFLRAFLAEAWPGEPIDTGGAVDIALEWPRSGVSDVTGLTVEARADLVMTLESLVIVIENKLDAGEGADQCERLYWPWAQDPIETRWVFLTPSGREPVTATSDVACAAWRSLGYAQVRRALVRALEGAPDRPGDPGRASAVQHLATLNAQRHS